MTRFEYRILLAPAKADDPGAILSGGDGRTSDRRDASGTTTVDGWEFVGRKEVPVERRRWLVLRQTETEEFLIFRRAIPEPERTAAHASESSPGPAPTVRPRRVLRSCFPDLGISDTGFRRARLRVPHP